MPSNVAGYLLQTQGPMDDQALHRFLHGLIAGVLGFDAKLVRPLYQVDPPAIPSIITDWVAFGIVATRHEHFGSHQQYDGYADVITHEELDVLCVFYGPNALSNATKLRDGIELVSQNREALLLAGIGAVQFSDATRAPELVNDRWFNRVDITMTLRREVRRRYDILTLLDVETTVRSETL